MVMSHWNWTPDVAHSTNSAERVQKSDGMHGSRYNAMPSVRVIASRDTKSAYGLHINTSQSPQSTVFATARWIGRCAPPRPGAELARSIFVSVGRMHNLTR